MHQHELEHGPVFIAGRVALITGAVLAVLLGIAFAVRPESVLHLLHSVMRGTRMMTGM